MAAPQYSELPKANGKIAPAIWDETNEQWIVLRGGIDGSMRVSGNLSIDNIPETQNVQDDMVYQKVEALRQLVEQQSQATKSVADTAVLDKLNELDTKVQGIIDGTTPANTQITGSNVGYSTDEKPTNANKGDDLIEIDTGKVFIYDGTQWVEI